MLYLEEVRVDNNTYIIDGNKELTTADVGKGYWMLGFDRDGTCFEMCKVDADSYSVQEVLTDEHVDITDFGGAVYYWSENSCDTGILHVH